MPQDLPDDPPEPDFASLGHAADGLRLLRLFHTLSSQEDRDALFRLVEDFVKSVQQRNFHNYR